jgi:O-antigen/teichoic acid export membrane protein
MLVNAPNGFAEMGVFNAANQWSQVIVFLAGTIANVSIPIISERLGQGDHRAPIRILRGSIAATGAMVMPIAVGASAFSPIIMGAYGSGFRQGWLTMVVAFATAALLAVQTPIGTVIQASGRMWIGAAMNCAWGATLVILTWIALPLGALGLALAGLGAYVAHGVWTFVVARRILAEYAGVDRQTQSVVSA